MAFERPDVEMTGYDISASMTQYASVRARSQELARTAFGVMDIKQPLELTDESFDLVNARFLAGVLLRDVWPTFIAECRRILKPGGILRLTEGDTFGVTSSPAAEQMTGLLWRAIQTMGYGFSVDGRSTGMSHRIPHLLRQAGFQEINYQAHALEFSTGMPGWIDLFRNYQAGVLQAIPLYIKLGLLSQEEADKQFQQMLIEMQDADFTGMWNFMSFWSVKE